MLDEAFCFTLDLDTNHWTKTSTKVDINIGMYLYSISNFWSLQIAVFNTGIVRYDYIVMLGRGFPTPKCDKLCLYNYKTNKIGIKDTTGYLHQDISSYDQFTLSEDSSKLIAGLDDKFYLFDIGTLSWCIISGIINRSCFATEYNGVLTSTKTISGRILSYISMIWKTMNREKLELALSDF